MRILTEVSLYWCIPCFIASALLSWYFYRKNEWLSSQGKALRIALPVLRTLGLFFIALLILDFTIVKDEKRTEKPIIVVVVDNSSSMTNHLERKKLTQQINAFISKNKAAFKEGYELSFYTVGEQIKEGSTLSFNEQKTNLESVFNHLAEQYLNRNIGAILLVSDGNFNTGESPMYAAGKISLTPIYTLGIGDTIPKKDQQIVNLYYNDVVFLKDQFPIEVDIEAIKIKNQTVNVTLSSGGKTLGTKAIKYENDELAFKQVNFQVNAEKIGLQAYTVTVSYVDGEFDRKNNVKTCYIEVVDSRNKICFVSSAPHPDISALRSAADENENYQASYETPEGILNAKIKPDLVVWQDPGTQFNASFYQYLESQRIPTLFIINAQSSARNLSQLNLMSVRGAEGQVDETQGELNPGFSSFELSDALKKEIAFFPPLQTKFGTMALPKAIEPLLYQRIGTTLKNEPLLYFSKRENQSPIGVLYGDGVWRWKLNEYVKHQSHTWFNELFSKTYTYLMVRKEGMGLSVQIDKRFNKFDPISINANFYNASLEAINSPLVNVEITGPNNKKYAYRLNPQGKGYGLDIGILPPGNYTWEASTSFDNKKFAKKGFFTVEDVALENLTHLANHGILKQLSSNSRGKFRSFDAYDKSIQEIKKREDVVPIERIESNYDYLNNYLLYLFFIASFFSIEWFLKRFYGAY